MRTKNSIINIAVSCSSYIFLMANAFITRYFVVRHLGDIVVGIDGVFLNIISMLAIAELGIGIGIVYKLYKPIADGDNRKIAVLLNFYKKAYTVIGVVVFTAGTITAGFVWLFIKGSDYSRITLSFFFMFYVFDVLCSYIYAHKRAMFTADQKNYINNISHTAAQAASCVLQVATLLLFKSFVVFLIIKVTLRLLENVAIALVYNKKYKHIDLKAKEKLPKEESNDLFGNIKALFLHRVAGFSINSTSSMILSNGANVILAGFYTNYLMITAGVTNLTNQLFNGITASFGNLLTTESKQKSFENFKMIFFMNYAIYSFLSVFLLVCLDPFISMWIKPQSVFPIETTLLIILYFYMTGMRQSIVMARTSAGIYRPDRYLAVMEAVINIVVAVVLVKPLGINGILIANIISNIAIPFWTQPRIVYNMILEKSIWIHYRRYFLYITIFSLSAALTYFVCRSLPIDNIFLKERYNYLLRLAVNASAAIIIPNIINIILFRKTPEFMYFKNTILGFLGGFKRKVLVRNK